MLDHSSRAAGTVVPARALRRRARSATLAALAAACAFGAAATPAGAQTTTITFDALGPLPPTGSQTINTQGYTFGCVNADTGTPCSTLGIVTPLGGTPSGPTGTPELFNNNIYGITTLARQGGGTFDLLRVDLGVVVGTGPVVFEGTVDGGAVVTQSFTVGGAVGALTSYVFSSAFRNLSAVRYRGTGFDPAATTVRPALDNVVVQVTTPEPAVVALVGVGVLGAGAARRRRRGEEASSAADRVSRRR